MSDIKEAFETAARLDPLHIEARWALVEFYIQLSELIGGSKTKAIKYADQLGEMSLVNGYLANGYVAEYSKRPLEAEIFYKKAIEVEDSPLSYENLPKQYEKNNQPTEAVVTSLEALKVHKRNQLNYQIGKIVA